MRKSDTAPGKDGVHCVKDLGQGELVLRLSEMPWETEFFERRFGRLEMEGAALSDLEAAALDEALEEILSFGDRNGFEIIELRLDVSWLHQICLFENRGFRLVDTRIRFLTSLKRTQEEAGPESADTLGFASEDMKGEILDLTQKAFGDNPAFKSRFNNRRYFSRSDTDRYYAAWVEKYLGDPNALFAVMREGGKITGYVIYARTGEYTGKAVYKAALIAVAPEHRGKRIYFALRSFVHNHFPAGEIYLDVTTQLTNFATIRNLVKTQHDLNSLELIFYRRRDD